MAAGDTVGSLNESLPGVVAALRAAVMVLAGLPFVQLGSSVKIDRCELMVRRVHDTLDGMVRGPGGEGRPARSVPRRRGCWGETL